FFTYASFLAVLDALIFLIVAMVSVASYFTTRLQPKYYDKHKKEWEKENRKKVYLQNLSEDFPRAKDIKLYGLGGWLEKMMRDYQGYILMWNKRCSLRGFFASVLSAAMAVLQNGTAYLVLIKVLLSGGITVGEFVFYFGLVGGIAGFLQGIIGDVANLCTRADKISYYREFYDFPNIFNHGKGAALPEAPVRVEFKDVWFRYDGAKDYTLKGINLTIEGGEKLALVGVNGAGKTTLVKLLCGLYQPEKGEILVGGRNISEYNIMEYYTMISAVFQEIRAVAFTVFEFVASADLNRKNAREEAKTAMEKAGIYEKVKTLSNGMDTHLMKGIYDDGVDFSGGELQKLVLARAIYKDGKILVLDEPTAALDPIAENNLYLKYQELTCGKTSVYISHRFASTRFCDRIILLEDGVVAESGSHKELMEANGQYAYMFRVQSQYYKENIAAAAAE
ncbi:MAG: ATP-binding cassette domain-containing protein, partial [Lachnospiraceae bacterium]|nr:ATP-binding cassette domain-containing protein [Lachnospiraceae bacterium]